MMMNERVEIGRGVASAPVVDEKLVVLHQKLKRIAKAKAHLDLQEAEALREAQRLQLWKQFAHTSLADYMVQELGYSSHRVAEDRLRLANALPQLPKIEKAIENGDLNMSQARELARVATKETEQAWIDKTKEMNARQVEQAVSGHAKGDLPEDPIDEKLVRKTMWLSVRPETEVLWRKVRVMMDKERGERLDEDAAMEALCRAYMSGLRTSDERSVPRGCDAASVPRGTETGSAARGNRADKQAEHSADSGRTAEERARGVCTVGERAGGGCTAEERAAMAKLGAPYRVAVTLCSNCLKGWQHGGGLVTQMTPPAVERAMCDAQWIGDIDGNVVERARQEISAAMRRKVLHRDQEKCRVPGCMAHRNLDIHHLWELMYGGSNEMSNLLTLCEAHHLAYHEGTLIIERVKGEVVFRWEGRNAFTRATREVATREVLRERGFDREQRAEIMRRTVTHVGETDLSEEQWIAIALQYAGTFATGRKPADGSAIIAADRGA